MRERILHHLSKMAHIPSPSGATDKVAEYIQNVLRENQHSFYENVRRHTRVRIAGRSTSPVLTWASHADTLGVMVKTNLTTPIPGVFCLVEPIGGFRMADFFNQMVLFPTPDGGVTGTLLYNAAGVHSELEETVPSSDFENGYLLCRLDSDIPLPEGTCGAVAAMLMEHPSGILRGRHLDSKADVAVMLAVIEHWQQKNYVPPHTVDFVFNMDEEPGIPTPIVAEDMTHCVALEFIPSELGCELDDIGIIGKDGRATSDPQLVEQLALMMRTKNKPFTVPDFLSDATLVAVMYESLGKPPPKVATIGFGMDGSHGNERTNIVSLEKLADFVNCFTLPAMQ